MTKASRWSKMFCILTWALISSFSKTYQMTLFKCVHFTAWKICLQNYLGQSMPLSLTSSQGLSMSLRRKLKDLSVSPKSLCDPLHMLPTLSPPLALPVSLFSNYTSLLDVAGRFQWLSYIWASSLALPSAWILQASPPSPLLSLCSTAIFSINPSLLTCPIFSLSITSPLTHYIIYSFFFPFL